MARLSISWLSCFGVIFVIIASFKVHQISAYNSGSGTNRTTEGYNFFTMQCSDAAFVVWIVLCLLLIVIAVLEIAFCRIFLNTKAGSEQEETFRRVKRRAFSPDSVPLIAASDKKSISEIEAARQPRLNYIIKENMVY
ncbi:Hypothetical predicted protein [Cloeon dipterum]|uniref:Uncharacterized protein n=1 Tax=Cloeon dipterum TaxID=197152 RepID=A0A8S1E0H3_9INSE|nr:Hypothetical predicted protein [Cloeon dipterum]